jgi:hypothetical protein
LFPFREKKQADSHRLKGIPRLGGQPLRSTKNRTNIFFMAFRGTVWQGPIPVGEQDQLLCTWMPGVLGPAFALAPAQAEKKSTAETVFDFSYAYQITPNISFQPDLQGIIRPKGTDTPSARVAGAQIASNF